jgi:hypothetical protein
LFIGEIGIPRREFLYDLQFWEARRILKGYQARHRNLWSATRWQTYNIMAAWNGKGLSEAGIHGPADLLQFPWDKEPSVPLSDEELDELKAEMAAMNEQLEKEQEQ